MDSREPRGCVCYIYCEVVSVISGLESVNQVQDCTATMHMWSSVQIMFGAFRPRNSCKIQLGCMRCIVECTPIKSCNCFVDPWLHWATLWSPTPISQPAIQTLILSNGQLFSLATSVHIKWQATNMYRIDWLLAIVTQGSDLTRSIINFWHTSGAFDSFRYDTFHFDHAWA